MVSRWLGFRLLCASLRRYVKGIMPGISGGWFLWFALQSPLLLAESALRDWASQRGIKLPAWARNALTWAVLLPLADLTYYRQDAVSGLQEDCQRDLQRTFGQLWNGMPGIPAKP